MELNLTHEMIRINEAVFDGTVEQSVELDYALPDYYPGIFKVLKCLLQPKIYNCRTSGDKLVVDGVMLVKVLYLCEEQNKLHLVEQKLPFSKTVDLKSEAEEPIIHYTVQGAYVNCRVVNPRRIDLRGAATFLMKVYNQRDEMVVSGAEGMGVQLNHSSMQLGNQHLWGTKQFSVGEQITLQPAAGEILCYDAVVIPEEAKIIANKLVAKGDVKLHLLYLPVGEELPPQTSVQTIPISQIIDLPGVDEDYLISVRFDVTGIELSVDGDEQQSRVDVDLDITACVDAYLQRDIPCVTDGFSTKYESELAFKEVKTELLAMLLDETLVSKQQTELDGFQTVSDLWASIQGLTVRPEQDQLNFEGELNLMVIGMDEEGMPAIADKTIPIDFQLPGTVPCGSVVAILNAEISNIQYTYQQGQLDLEADIKLGGQILCENRVGLVSDFVIKEDQPKQNTNRAALTIYYADPGEQVWDIAKRYNTSVDAIIEHNGLDGDALEAKQMLLVPIVE